VKRRVAVAGGWAALEEDGAVVALRPAGGAARSRVGEIWLGRVTAIRPELPAALVDLGFDRPAFLSAEDVSPKGGFRKLHQGQAVVVAVTKDARAGKAAGVTMRLRENALPPPGAKPPLRLAAPPPAISAWFDPAPSEILLDDRAAYAELRRWLMANRPELAERLGFSAESLFESFGIGAALDEAREPRVALPGGGALTIEPTALGVAIDVDAGRAASPLAANLEAARAVARQVRLRNLSGPILVGFVGMAGKSARGRVLAALAGALKQAVPDCRALGWTRLGHVELVRKRAAPSLAESLEMLR
jgi:Ribonuclease G/E